MFERIVSLSDASMVLTVWRPTGGADEFPGHSEAIMGAPYERSRSNRVLVWRAPADDNGPDRRRELSATDRHGSKRGSFPTPTAKLIEHGKPRLVPDARGHFPVLLKHASRKGSHAVGLPHKIREAFDPYGTRQEIREQDKAKAYAWRKLDAAALDLTGMH